MAGAFQHLSHGVTIMFNVWTLEIHQWQARQQYFHGIFHNAQVPGLCKWQDSLQGNVQRAGLHSPEL